MNVRAEEHAISEDALRGVDLPPATLNALAAGIPAELRLPNWGGPTLFSSELGEGRLVATTDEAALAPRSGLNEGYVIGSVRETSIDAPVIYSVFCLRRGAGDVVLLDLTDPSEDRFVNSSLETFMASMQAFAQGWPHMIAASPQREDLVRSFRDLLIKLDPRSLADVDHYWPAWIDELK